MVSIQLSFESLPREELPIVENSQDSLERVKAMKRQEKSYSCADYLNSGDAIDVNEESRRRMVAWCYQTVDFFKLSRNSVHIAMSCLDRFLCTEEGKQFLFDKSFYQLACIAALYIAIKVHEPVELGVSMLVKLCRGVYTSEQILETEFRMLNAIQWAVNPPTPKSFVQHFTTALPRSVSLSTRRDLLDLACYQADQALADYSSGALRSASSVALSGLINAMSLCPEISTTESSAFFRTLGKATACSRHTADVCSVKRLMQGQLEEMNSSITKQQSCIDCYSRERRSSISVRANTFQQRIMGLSMSPVAVTMEAR